MKFLGTVLALLILWSLAAVVYDGYNRPPVTDCPQGQHKVYVQNLPEDAGKYKTVCPKGQACRFVNTGETWTPAPRPVCILN